MKKIIYSLATVLVFSVAASAQDNGKSKAGFLSNSSTEKPKGPRYKNEYNPAVKGTPIKSAEANNSKGPNYKNNRSYKADKNSAVVIERSNLKGPKYKNERFK